MGWWPFNRGNKNEISSNAESISTLETQSNSDSKPLFLDDIPAKYPQQQLQQSQQLKEGQEGFSVSKEVKNFVSTLTFEHFYLSNLVQIPCFREAGLSGFSCFFVFSTVLYCYHRNLRKAVNWGFGGLLLGSIFGWENCNNQRRNSQMAVKLAQARFEKKHQKNEELSSSASS